MEIKPTKELIKSSKDLVERFQTRWSLLSLQTDYDRLLSLKEKAKTSEFWNNPEKAQEDTKLQNSIEKKLSPWLEIRQEIIDFPDLIEMTIEEKGDNALEELNQEFSFLNWDSQKIIILKI